MSEQELCKKLFGENDGLAIEYNYQEYIQFLNKLSANNISPVNEFLQEKDYLPRIRLNINYNEFEKIDFDLLKLYLVTDVTIKFDDVTKLNFDLIESKIAKIFENKSYLKVFNAVHYCYVDTKNSERDIEVLKEEAKAFKELIADINPDLSEFEKFAIIYSRIAKKTSYDYSVFENLPDGSRLFQAKEYNLANNLEGILTGKSVCEGYSIILSQALKLVGIESKVIHGFLIEDPYSPHAWNQVCLDGKWYNCDLTNDVQEISKDEVPEYCLKSDITFSKHHNEYTTQESNIRCPEDYSESTLRDFFEYNTVKNVNFNNPVYVELVDFNNFYPKMIINGNPVLVSSPDRMYDYLEKLSRGRFFNYIGNNSWTRGNVVVKMNAEELDRYLSESGFTILDFVNEENIENYKQGNGGMHR